MTKTIAKEVLKKREQVVKLGQEDLLDADIPALDRFAKEYLSYVRDTVKKRSWKRDELCLRHLINFYKGRILSDIKAQDVEDYKTARLSEVSAATVNRELEVLRHLFNLADRWDRFFGKNPVSRASNNPRFSLRINTIFCVITSSIGVFAGSKFLPTTLRAMSLSVTMPNFSFSPLAIAFWTTTLPMFFSSISLTTSFTMVPGFTDTTSFRHKFLKLISITSQH
ncbi:MAG: hypothetical protein WD000_09380 [Thermodesulfobacteriota bacterium]